MKTPDHGAPPHQHKTAFNKRETSMFVVFIIYLLVELLRLPSMFPVLAPLKLSFILQSIVILFAVSNGLRIFGESQLAKWVLIFCIVNLITYPITVNQFHWYQNCATLIRYLFAIIIPMILLLKNYNRWVIFIRTWMIINIIISIWVITHGGKGPGSFLTDENDVAMFLATGLPYPLLLLREKLLTGKWRRIAQTALISILAAIVATNSRGSFLGLVMAMIGYLYYYRTSFKTVASIFLVCVISWFFLPTEFKNEMLSISDKTDSTRGERIELWENGLFMFSMNPILGVGTGNYPWRIGEYEALLGYSKFTDRLHGGRPAHSFYVTILAELGLVGTIVYLRLVTLFIARNKTRSLISNKINHQLSHHKTSYSKSETFFNTISRANLIAFMSFSVSAAFISVLYYPSVWLLFGFTAGLPWRIRNSRSMALSAENLLPVSDSGDNRVR